MTDTDYELFPKAPITEAIIDFRVEPRADLKLEDLSAARIGLEADYPTENKIVEALAEVDIRPGASATTDTKLHQLGYRFTSAEKKFVWQSHVKGFTLSRLAPYDSWASFRDEAMRLWARYRECAAPARVTRQAVRYVNRIDIPCTPEVLEMDDYFRTAPKISPELPQSLVGFFMQLQIPLEDLKCIALINHTHAKPAREDVRSFILDIDLYRDSELPQGDAEIWTYFDAMRAAKNRVFHACLTDKARELFR